MSAHDRGGPHPSTIDMRLSKGPHAPPPLVDEVSKHIAACGACAGEHAKLGAFVSGEFLKTLLDALDTRFVGAPKNWRSPRATDVVSTTGGTAARALEATRRLFTLTARNLLDLSRTRVASQPFLVSRGAETMGRPDRRPIQTSSGTYGDVEYIAILYVENEPRPRRPSESDVYLRCRLVVHAGRVLDQLDGGADPTRVGHALGGWRIRLDAPPYPGSTRPLFTSAIAQTNEDGVASFRFGLGGKWLVDRGDALEYGIHLVGKADG